eukprot:6177818-Pleurochrysis_carterae.AAC.8
MDANGHGCACAVGAARAHAFVDVERGGGEPPLARKQPQVRQPRPHGAAAAKRARLAHERLFLRLARPRHVAFDAHVACERLQTGRQSAAAAAGLDARAVGRAGLGAQSELPAMEVVRVGHSEQNSGRVRRSSRP